MECVRRAPASPNSSGRAPGEAPSAALILAPWDASPTRSPACCRRSGTAMHVTLWRSHVTPQANARDCIASISAESFRSGCQTRCQLRSANRHKPALAAHLAWSGPFTSTLPLRPKCGGGSVVLRKLGCRCVRDSQGAGGRSVPWNSLHRGWRWIVRGWTWGGGDLRRRPSAISRRPNHTIRNFIPAAGVGSGSLIGSRRAALCYSHPPHRRVNQRRRRH